MISEGGGDMPPSENQITWHSSLCAARLFSPTKMASVSKRYEIGSRVRIYDTLIHIIQHKDSSGSSFASSWQFEGFPNNTAVRFWAVSSTHATLRLMLACHSSFRWGSLVRVSQHGDHVTKRKRAVCMECQQNEASFEFRKEIKHHLSCSKEIALLYGNSFNLKYCVIFKE